MSDRQQTALALAAITAVGAALRFYGLEIQSLWNDELSSWAKATDNRWTELIGVDPYHPPGHLMLIHFWSRVFGDSEVLLRLPSAIAGTLAIPATFFLGRRLYTDVEALIAAALMAVSWMAVFYSQEARAYALILLFSAVSTGWLIDIVRDLLQRRQPAARIVAGYVVTATAACYAHYFGLFFVALQGAIAAAILLCRNGAWLRLMAMYVLVMLAYIPVLWEAVTALGTRAPAWMGRPTPTSIWHVISFMFNRSDEITLAFLSVGVAALAVHAWRRRATPQAIRRALSSPTALLLLWVVAPIAIIYARSVLVSPAFTQRNFIIVAPALYLLAARAITGLLWRRRYAYVAGCGVVTLLLADLVLVNRYYKQQTKNQFRQATAYLVGRDDPGKVAVVLSSAWSPRYFEYYLERFGSARRVDLETVRRDDVAEAVDLIDRRAPDEIWFLAGHRFPEPGVIRALKERFPLIEQRGFRTAHVWRFRYKRRPVIRR